MLFYIFQFINKFHIYNINNNNKKSYISKKEQVFQELKKNARLRNFCLLHYNIHIITKL